MEETTEGRRAAMRRLDARQARLIELALTSLGQDVVGLVAGTELSEDPLDAANWATDQEEHQAEQIKQALGALRETLEALGFRALVFVASDAYLSKPRD